MRVSIREWDFWDIPVHGKVAVLDGKPRFSRMGWPPSFPFANKNCFAKPISQMRIRRWQGPHLRQRLPFANGAPQIRSGVPNAHRHGDSCMHTYPQLCPRRRPFGPWRLGKFILIHILSLRPGPPRGHRLEKSPLSPQWSCQWPSHHPGPAGQGPRLTRTSCPPLVPAPRRYRCLVRWERETWSACESTGPWIRRLGPAAEQLHCRAPRPPPRGGICPPLGGHCAGPYTPPALRHSCRLVTGNWGQPLRRGSCAS